MEVHPQQVAADLLKLSGAAKTFQHLIASQTFHKFDGLIREAFKTSSDPQEVFKEHLKVILTALVEQVHVTLHMANTQDEHGKPAAVRKSKLKFSLCDAKSTKARKPGGTHAPSTTSSGGRATPVSASARSTWSLSRPMTSHAVVGGSQGSLEMLSEFGHISSPTARFSNEKRRLSEVPETSPGPGAYRPSSAMTMRSPQGVTLDIGGDRTELGRKTASPGPGAYQPKWYPLSRRG
jgi:hypothetical protein